MKKRWIRFSNVFVLVVVALTAMFTAQVSVNAESSATYKVADVVKLQKFLSTVADELTVNEAKAYDVNADGKLTAVDLTLMKQFIVKEKDTTTFSTTNETTISTTEETTTVTTITTTVSGSTVDGTGETTEDPREMTVTDPNGAIIPRKTYATLVEYAKENKIDEYDVIWTGGKLINNSVIVLEYKSINTHFCKGAFRIMRGKEFLEMVRKYLDEDLDFMEISDLENVEFVAWRHCDKKYLEENPSNILSGFDSDETDIKYFKWSQYEDEIYWALIPKKKT